MKQGTLNRPTSHLVHLYTVPFLWLREAHRQQRIWVDDFTGQCLLWRLSSRKTFFAPTLVLTTNLGLGWSWLSSASSINFLTRRSLKSLWVYLAPHEGNSIQLLSTVRSRRWKNSYMVHILLDWQKNEYFCSFLEAVPMLVISHLLQPVVWLLLRPAAAAAVVPLYLLLHPQNNLQHCLPQHLIPTRCQQPEFHWWHPEILFFPSHYWRPTVICLV